MIGPRCRVLDVMIAHSSGLWERQRNGRHLVGYAGDFAGRSCSLVQSWVGERVASHRIADHKAHLAPCDGRDETASRPPTLGIEA
jgi:hypothetical protein